eukprot:9602-Heterococcus_DN1.PRE.4
MSPTLARALTHCSPASCSAANTALVASTARVRLCPAGSNCLCCGGSVSAEAASARAMVHHSAPSEVAASRTRLLVCLEVSMHLQVRAAQ